MIKIRVCRDTNIYTYDYFKKNGIRKNMLETANHAANWKSQTHFFVSQAVYQTITSSKKS